MPHARCTAAVPGRSRPHGPRLLLRGGGFEAACRRWAWRIARRGPTRRARTARWRASMGAFSARCSAPRCTAMRILRCGSRVHSGLHRPGPARPRRPLTRDGRAGRLAGVPTRANPDHEPPLDLPPCPRPSRSSLAPSTSRNHTEAVGYALIAVRHPPG